MLLALLAPRAANAQSCTSDDAISLRFVGAGWDDGLARDTFQELEAATRAEGMTLCRVEGHVPPDTVAHVDVTLEDGDARIEVHDRVTHKRLRRAVPLAELIEDARAFALAVAIDELLRASWIEIALERERPAEEEPPPEVVTRIVRRELESPRLTQLGIAAWVDGYGGGVVLLGPAVYASHMFVPEVGAELTLGLGFGPPQPSPNGEILARSYAGELALRVRLVALDDFALLARAGARVASLELEGRARAPATDRVASGVTVVPFGGAEAQLAFDWLVLRLAVDVGGVARGVEAVDTGATTYAVDGVAVSGRLAAGVRL